MAEDFLRRWSRLKHERAVESPSEPEEKKPLEKAPEPADLPPVEKLTPQSDFKPFMQPKVEDSLRRVALKTLFRDPHFNTPDPFEPFSGDWRVAEEIAPEMLAGLNQARTLLFSDEKKAEEKKAEEEKAAQGPVVQEEKPKPDEPGQQNA